MRVAVLEGGRSLEREVSLRSADRVVGALRHLGHDVRSIDVSHDLVRDLEADRPDLVFVALHGRDGEDGTVQELLEVLELPYTGSRVAACARCSDKVLGKHELRSAGLPTPDWVGVTEAAFKELGAADALDRIGHRLGFPLVVKPARQGSGLGLRIVENRAAVPAALVAAFSYDERVLLERHVRGRDLCVSVLGGEALPVVEPLVREAGPADDAYAARYTIGGSELSCPADLDEATTRRVQELGVAAYEALDCRGFARVDLMLDTDGGLHLLEINAVPGLTHTSWLPMAAETAGIGFEPLVARVVELALAVDTTRA